MKFFNFNKQSNLKVSNEYKVCHFIQIKFVQPSPMTMALLLHFPCKNSEMNHQLPKI